MRRENSSWDAVLHPKRLAPDSPKTNCPTERQRINIKEHVRDLTGFCARTTGHQSSLDAFRSGHTSSGLENPTLTHNIHNTHITKTMPFSFFEK
jgi:hypothetical protein